MKSIAVFCGSSFGIKKIFEQYAYELGQTLANKNINLVYGGAKVGLMGAVANGALSENGTVIGVLPKFLEKKELAHPNLSEMVLVQTMHERKLKMSELSDGVIALPGGFGTIEELFEMLTWGQLGLHQKPIGLLNIDGFYNPLIEMVQKMVIEGFLRPENKQMLLLNNNIDALIKNMKTYKAHPITKWINKTEKEP